MNRIFPSAGTAFRTRRPGQCYIARSRLSGQWSLIAQAGVSLCTLQRSMWANRLRLTKRWPVWLVFVLLRSCTV
jgi:hypothetical protein